MYKFIILYTTGNMHKKKIDDKRNIIINLLESVFYISAVLFR